MKLKEYYESLKNLIDENPEALDYEVVTSIDDEGNGFNIVNFHPAIGVYIENDMEFINIDQLEEFGHEGEKPNCVCLN